MDKLIADELFNDPKVAKGKELLLQAIDSAQSKITEVKPAAPERKKSYEELILAFNEMRGGDLYYPYIGSGIGKGALVELLDGSIKYDMICGIGPHYFGHSHPGLISSAIDSAISNMVMQGNLQQNIEPLHLMERLTKASGLDHCFLASSGAMATENGLKIAFHHKKGATRVLAFDGCFMGRTLALSQITDKAQFRVGLPHTLNVDYIPFFDEKRPEESAALANKELRKILARYPGQHAAMCFELVQGEGGIKVGSRPFFLQLINTLKEHDVPILVDEVQTFGRTPKLFAFQHFELEKNVDIVTIGKLSLVCATLFTNKMKPKPGLLSQTFTASSSAIGASIYIVDDLTKGNYFGPNGENALFFNECEKRFKQLENKHSGAIRGPYGIGAMLAFTPFEGEPQQTMKVAKDLFDEGLITFLAGQNPSRIRMLAPVPVLTPSDLDKIFSIIDKVIGKQKEQLL